MSNKNFNSMFFIKEGCLIIKQFKTRKSVEKYFIANNLPKDVFICEARLYRDGSLFNLIYDKNFNPKNAFKWENDKGFQSCISLRR